MFAGGFGDTKEADETVKELAKGMQKQVEEELGETFQNFQAVLYSTQVVAGTNYLIKVYVGNNRYVHIKVHVPLPFTKRPNQLMKCEGEKTFYDSLK